MAKNLSKVPASKAYVSNKMIKGIVNRYVAGETAQQIADDLGYSRQYITKIIKKHGVPRNAGRHSKLKITIDDILKRSNDGEPATTIAKDAGCSAQNIRLILKDHKKPKVPKVNEPHVDADFGEITDYLFEALKSDFPEELEKMEESISTFDKEFLGFVNTYYYMSKLVPTNRTIYDMGCCWGFQSYFFRNHKKYIGVDALIKSEEKQIQLPNNEYHDCTIKEFLKKNKIAKRHFAICNYVPPWDDDNDQLVREYFKHLYVYYP